MDHMNEPQDYEPAVCANCGEDVHTAEQLAECMNSMLDDRVPCINCGGLNELHPNLMCGYCFDPSEAAGGDYPLYLDNGGSLTRKEWESAGYPLTD